MAFTKFREYLEKNGSIKLQTKPIVSLDGDTSKYPNPNKPEKAAKKGKNWHVEAAVVDDDNGPLSYNGDGKDPGLQVAGDDSENSPPLAMRDVPQSGMVYHPKTDPSQNLDVSIDSKKTIAVPFKANAPAKTVQAGMPSKTESFLRQTSGLTAEKYAEFVLKNSGGTAISEVTEFGKKLGKNDSLYEAFVREVKRRGNFEKLMQAVLNQPESYYEFALAVASDEAKARQVAKAINEATAKPAVEDDDDEEDEDGMPRPQDKVMPKDASTLMPPDAGQVDTRGKPVPGKKPMLKPEHALIQALAAYKNIRTTMQEVLGS